MSHSAKLFNNLLISTRTLLSEEVGNHKPLKILLALSGGPDSVFLFHLLHRLAQDNVIKLAIAHVNHNWRESSIVDATFSSNLAQTHGYTFFYKKNIALDTTFSEAKGRALRYSFFEEICAKEKYTLTALAHNQDDQVETLFIRLARGAGLSGLACMSTFNGNRFRPLLNTKKKDILTWLKDNNIAFCHDPTNESLRYLRNRIRSQVVPLLNSIDNRFDKNITKSINHLASYNNFLEKIVQQTLRDCTLQINPRKICLTRFSQLEPILQKEILLKLLIESKASFTPSQKFFAEIIRFLQNNKGNTHKISPSDAITKRNGAFGLQASNQEKASPPADKKPSAALLPNKFL